jgi:hypothetical protein
MRYDWLQTVGTRVIDPSYVLVALIAASAALCLARRPRTAASLSVAALALVAVVSIKPLPHVFLLGPLEARFPVWRDDSKDVSGIVILGGGLNVELARWRPGSGLASPSGRLTEAVFLARRFPHAKLLYSGGGEIASEAEQGRVLLARLE